MDAGGSNGTLAGRCFVRTADEPPIRASVGLFSGRWIRREAPAGSATPEPMNNTVSAQVSYFLLETECLSLCNKQ